MAFAASSPSTALGGDAAFVSLLPSGGATWSDIAGLHIALHPCSPRLFTIASATDGLRLLRVDTITGGVLSSSPIGPKLGWFPLDAGVWASGDEVLVAWGTGVAGGGERFEPMGLSRVDARTGEERPHSDDVRFLAFDIEPQSGQLWGVGVAPGAAHYRLIRFDPTAGVVSSTPTAVLVEEAVVRDALLDAQAETLFCLLQPAVPGVTPSVVSEEGLVIAYRLPGGEPYGPALHLPSGVYRMGGWALDAARKRLYAAPANDADLYRIDVARWVVDATYSAADIGEGFQFGGAVAVRPPTGELALANDADAATAARVVLYDPDARATVRAWSSGADPNRLAFDPGLDRFYAASLLSQSIAVIEASREPELLQSPIGILPRDLVLDRANRRLLLAAEGGEVYVIDTVATRLLDRIDSLGVRPSALSAVGIVLDPPHNRFYSGTVLQAAPAVFDSGSLAWVGTLGRGGSALAASPGDGLVFQTGIDVFPTGPIVVTAATDDTIQWQVPASARFSKTVALAVDDVHKRLYGIGRNRGEGLGPGAWYYDWVDDASGDLVLPAAPAGSWSPLSHVAVNPESGRIALTGYSAGHYLLLYTSPDDASPAVVPLSQLESVVDLETDPVRGLVAVLGIAAGGAQGVLVWGPLHDASALAVEPLPFPAPPVRLAIDAEDGVLWLASARPSGLYRLPWPPSGGAARFGVQASLVALRAVADGASIRVDWTVSPPPAPGTEVVLLRQDGELAAWREILPHPLPHTAVAFLDADVTPGMRYRYCVELRNAAGVAGTAGEWTDVPTDRPGAIAVRPLSWVSRVPVGGTAAVALAVEGAGPFTMAVGVSALPALWLAAAGISVVVPPDGARGAGLVSVELETAPHTPPGRYAVPLEVRTAGRVLPVWVFAEVWLPLGEAPDRVPTYAGRSRRIGIHTDSRLREGAGHVLAIKGDIGAQAGDTGGTGVVACVDAGDGTILEYRDLTANSGRYSFGIRLPELHERTMVRAQVTWLGSSTSPGGTSPVLCLPVGACSVADARRPGSAAVQPEPALLVRGMTPCSISPPPLDTDVEALVADARRTFLVDFSNGPRPALQTIAEITAAMRAAAGGRTVLLYAVAETAERTVRLPDGSALTRDELAQYTRQLDPEAALVLMIEGPKSGWFAGPYYGEAATVVTSSATGAQVNTLSPWWESFSTRFFSMCRRGTSVAVSFTDAGRTFYEDPFGGQRQLPQLVPGRAADLSLAARFFPAELPDLMAPEMVEIDSRLEENGDLLLTVLAADNRDAAPQIDVSVSVFAIDRPLLGPLPLARPLSPREAHVARLSQLEAPWVALRVVARDRAGNESLPFRFWTPAVPGALPFDVSGDGQVGQDDLRAMIGIGGEYGLDRHWVMQLSDYWMRETGRR